MTDEKTGIASESADLMVTAVRTADTAAPPPFSIPGIELGARLGQGGMAVVFEGFDHGFRPPRHVAVKFMDPSLSKDDGFRVRFEREASMMAAIHHPNIVDVFASGEVDGTKYLIMRYLPGGTLSQKIETGDLTPAASLGIANDLAGALAYCHQRGIVHRDLKPGNVMFAEDGKTVLTDFGVAKAITGARTELTRARVAIGAPAYMPPEQLVGLPVTDKADVFSLGLTLFQMLTGALPPEEERIQSGSDGAARLATFLRSDLRAVAGLICECLQGDPEARPTAVQFQQSLSDCTGSSLTGTSSDSNRTAGSTSPLKRMLLTATGLVVLLALGFGSFDLWTARAPPAGNSQDRAPHTDNSTVPGPQTQQAAATTSASAPAPSDQICGLSVSETSLGALITDGLKAQVDLTFATGEADQKNAGAVMRRTADCVRRFEDAGYTTAQSRQWLKDAAAVLAEKQ